MQGRATAARRSMLIRAVAVGDKVPLYAACFPISSWLCWLALCTSVVLTDRLCTQLPGDIKLTYFDAENKMQEVSVDDLTKGKKVRWYCCPCCHTLDVDLFGAHLPG